MVSNDLPQVLYKKTAARDMSILFCVFIKELGQIVKNQIMTIISWRWRTKIYFFGDTWKSVQFFCLVKCLGQHKWWKLFPTNIDRNVLNHIDMVRPFCGFPVIGCYQDHGLLSSTHVLITQSHSCIYGAWKILYGCYTVSLNCPSEVL